MKRLVIVFALIVCAMLTGCNTQIVDTTYWFKRAQIKLPDGTIVEGKVDSWKDYADSDAVQIVIDGVTYYTFLGNVVLICD